MVSSVVVWFVFMTTTLGSIAEDWIPEF
jgi:hypothetical protein